MHFSPTDPRCHGNEIFTDKMAYNSACVKDFREIFALIVDFGDAPSNAESCIFTQPTHVAITAKIETKWAINQLA